MQLLYRRILVSKKKEKNDMARHESIETLSQHCLAAETAYEKYFGNKQMPLDIAEVVVPYDSVQVKIRSAICTDTAICICILTKVNPKEISYECLTEHSLQIVCNMPWYEYVHKIYWLIHPVKSWDNVGSSITYCVCIVYVK